MEADGTTLHKVNEITLQLFRLNEQPWKWGGGCEERTSSMASTKRYFIKMPANNYNPAVKYFGDFFQL